ncbi:hypothetical protein JZO76_07610 [Enterococcus sp. MJM12]|uniref:Uncharacterized protein n=1 Tax=Candidatus Enterococcus myersii TaxID=2815322 RepID=A0ABS3H7J6_9ENTE|nr:MULTISPECIES: hypothetical protein [Enterococcus]MBO0449404.1 hypothetical protein [Enterococcus sp. MJM12]MCD1025549.1 hypothetical protein [Enterococcus sp. SMC-9]MDT2738994.1 hypothetical protein [Enterococcus canintestini]WHA09624.1 hypothetical protein P3T75_01910 [Enterococcus montenegrensis]
MKEKMNVKKFGNFVANTSNALLKGFLSDSMEEELQAKISVEMAETLVLAAEKESLVVLQLDIAKNSVKYETVYGWILNKQLNPNHLVIKPQNNEQQMRMIPLESIRKVSILDKEGQRTSITRA